MNIRTFLFEFNKLDQKIRGTRFVRKRKSTQQLNLY